MSLNRHIGIYLNAYIYTRGGKRMIGKGREQTGESKKSRERERRKRREKDLYIVNCIIVLFSLLLLLCHYLLPSQNSHRLSFNFSHFSPLLPSSKLPSTALLYSWARCEGGMHADVCLCFLCVAILSPSSSIFLPFLTWGCCVSAI